MIETKLIETIIDYDLNEFPFPEIVRNHLNVEKLDELHLIEKHEVLTREKDQSTGFHSRYYEIGDEFYGPYIQFLKQVIRPIIGEQLVYQKIPTFRVQLAENVAVGDFHRDREYAHHREEINFLVALTDAWDTNTIWIESEEGKEDYHPINLKVGQVAMFDGANLKHGNKINDTGKTRVSVDFRVIPLSQYKETEGSSINMATPMTIGGYFELLED